MWRHLNFILLVLAVFASSSGYAIEHDDINVMEDVRFVMKLGTVYRQE